MKIKTLALCLAFLLPSISSAFSGSEVHITKDGVATFSDVKVMQIAGTTFFTRLYWGDSFVRLTVVNNSKTKFFRGTGEPTTIAEISEGDMLDIVGQLGGGGALNIIPTSVKNSSVQKKQTILSGKVTSVDLARRGFVLNDTKSGLVTILATSTTRFIKGNRTLDLEHVLVGDTITKTSGDYNITTKTMIADTVVTYVDLNYYKPKNFQGILKEVNLDGAPVSIKVLIDNKLFTVNFTEKVSILNKARGVVTLPRFVVGDVIRMYGSIREIDEPVMDIEVVRNLNL